MTKKHFEALARQIRNILDPHVRLNAAVAVAAACKETNRRFDFDRFYEACGVTDMTVTKVNLMTGKEYQERVGTPLSCSPASETYWSM